MREIILEHSSRIKAIIRKMTGRENDDIEQEVYIKLWKNQNSYQDRGKLCQWINTITANICRDYFRSCQYKMEKRRVGGDEILESVISGGKQEEIIDAKARQKIILKAIDDLPKKMKQAIILFEYEDLSLEDIARKTGVPLGTVKSRLHQARKILSEKLSFLKENNNE